MSSLYITSMLDISTAHITQATAESLGDTLQQNLGTAPFIAYEKGEYGFFVYVPKDVPSNLSGENNPEFPADLKACMEFAREKGCSWIMFDRDGQTIAELGVFDW